MQIVNQTAFPLVKPTTVTKFQFIGIKTKWSFISANEERRRLNWKWYVPNCITYKCI